MRKIIARIAGAAVAGVTIVAASALVAVAAPAHAAYRMHQTHDGVTVRISFSKNGRVETVRIIKDVHHFPVSAMGNCLSSGIVNETGSWHRGPGVAHITCRFGAWESAGWADYYRPVVNDYHYHAARGTRNLVG